MKRATRTGRIAFLLASVATALSAVPIAKAYCVGSGRFKGFDEVKVFLNVDPDFGLTEDTIGLPDDTIHRYVLAAMQQFNDSPFEGPRYVFGGFVVGDTSFIAERIAQDLIGVVIDLGGCDEACVGSFSESTIGCSFSLPNDQQTPENETLYDRVWVRKATCDFFGSWQVDYGNGAGFQEVIAHELGHSLSLGHSDKDPADCNAPGLPANLKGNTVGAMLSTVQEGRGRFLWRDDIEGLNRMYAVPKQVLPQPCDPEMMTTCDCVGIPGCDLDELSCEPVPSYNCTYLDTASVPVVYDECDPLQPDLPQCACSAAQVMDGCELSTAKCSEIVEYFCVYDEYADGYRSYYWDSREGRRWSDERHLVPPLPGTTLYPSETVTPVSASDDPDSRRQVLAMVSPQGYDVTHYERVDEFWCDNAYDRRVFRSDDDDDPPGRSYNPPAAAIGTGDLLVAWIGDEAYDSFTTQLRWGIRDVNDPDDWQYGQWQVSNAKRIGAGYDPVGDRYVITYMTNSYKGAVMTVKPQNGAFITAERISEERIHDIGDPICHPGLDDTWCAVPFADSRDDGPQLRWAYGRLKSDDFDDKFGKVQFTFTDEYVVSRGEITRNPGGDLSQPVFTGAYTNGKTTALPAIQFRRYILQGEEGGNSYDMTSIGPAELQPWDVSPYGPPSPDAYWNGALGSHDSADTGAWLRLFRNDRDDGSASANSDCCGANCPVPEQDPYPDCDDQDGTPNCPCAAVDALADPSSEEAAHPDGTGSATGYCFDEDVVCSRTNGGFPICRTCGAGEGQTVEGCSCDINECLRTAFYESETMTCYGSAQAGWAGAGSGRCWDVAEPPDWICIEECPSLAGPDGFPLVCLHDLDQGTPHRQGTSIYGHHTAYCAAVDCGEPIGFCGTIAPDLVCRFPDQPDFEDRCGPECVGDGECAAKGYPDFYKCSPNNRCVPTF